MKGLLPLEHPKTDAKEFIEILTGRKRQVRTPLVEYVVERLLGRRWVEYGHNRKTQEAYLDNVVEFWYRMGYDFVRFEQSLSFLEPKLVIQDATPGSPKAREWADEHQGVIGSWQDFERFRWPKVEEFDFSHRREPEERSG